MNAKPSINVTPLIDVLLVLLIIFMIITPLKPTDFKTQIPQEAEKGGKIHPDTLIVALNSDSSLKLNTLDNIATVEDPENLIQKLADTFKERKENQAYSQRLVSQTNLSSDEKIEKTVFIKAPRSIDYGSVAKVIDAVKISGASPISLQIDDLGN